MIPKSTSIDIYFDSLSKAEVEEYFKKTRILNDEIHANLLNENLSFNKTTHYHDDRFSNNQDFAKSRAAWAMLSFHVFPMTLNDINMLLESLKNKTTLPKFIKIADRVTGLCCPACGKNPPVEFNGTELRFAEPCDYPQGMPSYKFTMDFPSGEIFVGGYEVNKCFSKPKNEYSPEMDLNSSVGTKNLLLHYAQQSLLQIVVCDRQGIFNKTKNGFVIGREGENDDGDVLLPGKKIYNGSKMISVVDMAFLPNGIPKQNQPLPEDCRHKIIKIKPGKYEIEITPENIFNNDGEDTWENYLIYAEAKWIENI